MYNGGRFVSNVASERGEPLSKSGLLGYTSAVVDETWPLVPRAKWKRGEGWSSSLGAAARVLEGCSRRPTVTSLGCLLHVHCSMVKTLSRDRGRGATSTGLGCCFVSVCASDNGGPVSRSSEGSPRNGWGLPRRIADVFVKSPGQ